MIYDKLVIKRRFRSLIVSMGYDEHQKIIILDGNKDAMTSLKVNELYEITKNGLKHTT